MNGVGVFLRWVFTNLVYPLLVLGVFGFISVVIADFVLAVTGERRIRRLVAAALPLTVVVFALVPADSEGSDIQALLALAGPWMRFITGVLLGVLGLALGRALAKRDTEIAAAMYVLFLSAIASFIVYCLVEGVLRNLHVFLLGMVLGGGLYVIFWGAPVLSRRTARGAGGEAT
jgi:hypothetical protein